MKDDEISVLINELYLLDKGVRDCFSITVMGEEEEIGDSLEYIISKVMEHGYYMYTKSLPNDKACIVYVCKYNYQKLILHKIYKNLEEHSILFEYCIGSILGYSGEAMENFITKIIINRGINIIEEREEDEITSPI